jgi:phosphoribosylanthranilate isomerase
MTTRTRVKICGLTRLEDAELAAALGADAVGFVLWQGSPRAIAPVDVGRISRRLPPFVTRVGVFVNARREEIERAVSQAALDVAQIHGDTDPETIANLGVHVVRATSLQSDAELATVLGWPANITPIVDAHDPTRHGGTGRQADWARAATVSRTRPIVLAGGLKAENVDAAIVAVRPFAVDVSSGVERSPGEKDPARLRAFFAAVHACQEDR